MDDPAFNPITHINEILVPEVSDLEKINEHCQNFKSELQKLDFDLHSLLIQTQEQGQKNISQMEATKDATMDLISNVKNLELRASQTESTVREVTEGIRGLDLAKKNITQTINFSRRLQMLVSAVNQLRTSINQRLYSEAGPLIQAIEELFINFKDIRHIRPIFELRSTITELQQSLLEAAMTEIKAGISSSGAAHNPTQLKNACEAAEKVEGQRHLTQWYTDLQLKEYELAFCGDDEVSDLIHFPQRFAWLKRFIQTYENGAHGEIFPKDWEIPCKVSLRICETTAQNLTHLLEGQVDVGLMVKIMQAALAFEQQLDLKFPNSEGEPTLFSGMFSCCFEPHLQRYLDREASTLETKLAEYRSAPPSPDPEAADVRILLSGTDLLLFYQDSLLTLSKVTKTKALLDLARIMAKGLESYADAILGSLLPKEDRRNEGGWLDMVSLVLNTAYYCHGTTGQLQERFEGLLAPSFRDQQAFDSAREALMDCANLALKRLVKGCEPHFDPVWLQLQKLNTGYLTTLSHTLQEMSGQIQKTINFPVAYRSFCDRISEVLISRWTDTIFKISRLPTLSAQQLEKDSETFLKLLEELPVLASGQPPPQTFKKTIHRLYKARLEKYLKLIQLPLEDESNTFLESFFDLYSLEDPTSLFPKFLRIMEARGIKRSEQVPLREALQSRLLATSTSAEGYLASNRKRGSLDVSSNCASPPVSPTPPQLSSLATPSRRQSLAALPTPAPNSAPSIANSHQRFFQSNFRRLVENFSGSPTPIPETIPDSPSSIKEK